VLLALNAASSGADQRYRADHSTMMSILASSWTAPVQQQEQQQLVDECTEMVMIGGAVAAADPFMVPVLDVDDPKVAAELFRLEHRSRSCVAPKSRASTLTSNPVTTHEHASSGRPCRNVASIYSRPRGSGDQLKASNSGASNDSREPATRKRKWVGSTAA
jgi:hypothetical protein